MRSRVSAILGIWASGRAGPRRREAERVRLDLPIEWSALEYDAKRATNVHLEASGAPHGINTIPEKRLGHAQEQLGVRAIKACFHPVESWSSGKPQNGYVIGERGSVGSSSKE